jgi:hypothetical protein
MDRGPTGTGSPPTSFAGSVGVVGAVEVQGDAACSRVVPIGCGRLCAGRCVPLQFAGFDASEEPAPAEDRMVASQLDQSSGERRKLLVSRGPVEPADLVVLAVCVVVPSLRAAEFVAAENHRDSEGEQQGGQHGAPLPRTQVTTAGSVVGPSTPQFQERLSSVPSRFDSPLASLCLTSYETRSARVNPSWTVIRLIDAVGRRPAFE